MRECNKEFQDEPISCLIAVVNNIRNSLQDAVEPLVIVTTVVVMECEEASAGDPLVIDRAREAQQTACREWLEKEILQQYPVRGYLLCNHHAVGTQFSLHQQTRRSVDSISSDSSASSAASASTSSSDEDLTAVRSVPEVLAYIRAGTEK